MHREKGGQTASGHRDIVGDKSGQQLNRVYNFIDRAAARVGEYSRKRVNQPRVRQIAILFHDFRSRERQRDVIEDHPSVHECAADRDQSTTETRVAQHDLTILAVFHVHPVVLDQVYARTYASLADHEHAVLYRRHQEKTERAA